MYRDAANPVDRMADPPAEPVAPRGQAVAATRPAEQVAGPALEPRHSDIRATVRRARSRPDASVLDILSRPIKSRLAASSFSPGGTPAVQAEAPPPPKVTPKVATALNVFGSDSFKLIDMDTVSWGGADHKILFDAEEPAGKRKPPPPQPADPGPAPAVSEPMPAPPADLAQALADTVDRSITVDVAERHRNSDNPEPRVSSPRIINGMPGSVALVGNSICYDPGDEYDDLAVGEILAAEIGYRLGGGDPDLEEQKLKVFVSMTEDGPLAHIAPVNRKDIQSEAVEEMSLEEFVAAASNTSADPGAAMNLAGPMAAAPQAGPTDLETLLIQAWAQEWGEVPAHQVGLDEDLPETAEIGEQQAAPIDPPAFAVASDPGVADPAQPARESRETFVARVLQNSVMARAVPPEQGLQAEDQTGAAAYPQPGELHSHQAEAPPARGKFDFSGSGREGDHLAERMRAILGEAEGER